MLLARANFANPVTDIENQYDYNGDGKVDADDISEAISAPSSLLTMLNLIEP